MAVSSFEELCAGFCELMRVPAPALSADEYGRVAFHVELRGAVVNLVHLPERSPEHLFVLFEMGPVSRGGVGAADELQSLLEANHVLLDVHAPTISLDPSTGEGILQYVYPLFQATANDLLDLIEKGFAWLAQWRRRLAERCGGAASSPADHGWQPAESLSHALLHRA
jgi:hypothetical protein